MLISVLNSKGGVGKTTIAVHLAVWLRDQGLRVAVLDADEQQSTTRWVSTAAPEIRLSSNATTRDILDAAPSLQGTHDVVVADGPAALCGRLAVLASLADLVLLPLLPSALDIWASYRTARLIYKVRLRGRRPMLPQAITVLNRVQSRTRLAQLAASAVRNYGFPVCPVAVEARAAFAEACDRGTVVWRLGGRASRATAEMAGVFRYMLPWLPDTQATATLRRADDAARAAGVVLVKRTAEAQSVLGSLAAPAASADVLRPGMIDRHAGTQAVEKP